MFSLAIDQRGKIQSGIRSALLLMLHLRLIASCNTPSVLTQPEGDTASASEMNLKMASSECRSLLDILKSLVDCANVVVSDIMIVLQSLPSNSANEEETDERYEDLGIDSEVIKQGVQQLITGKNDLVKSNVRQNIV